MLRIILTVLYISTFIQAETNNSLSTPEIVLKSRWGARMPLEIQYALIPLEYVIVHHTVTPTCTSETSCSELILNIQNFHMNELEFHDIGYNFLVGGDGRIYEGAGWHKVGAHTYGYNTKSLGLAFIGNFSDKVPEEIQMKAAQDFLAYGVKIGELDEKYKLLGGRQVSATQSPGLKFYWQLKKWKHWVEKP